MKNLTMYRKGFVLSLVMVLLTFGYSQAEELSVDHTYDKAIRSVMWIITDDAYASGVLIDKGDKFAVTNEHVTKNHASVRVVFPVRDAHGNLISERDFYVDESNRKVLERLGYAIKGRVIAEDSKRDLAIIHLSGVPETAHEIDHDFSNHPYREMEHRDPVDILGNPGGRKLWQWTAGRFREVIGNLLHINANIYGGNSGGPLLNDQGLLIGIIKSSDRLMNTYAVPSEYIQGLLKTLERIQIFSIENKTTFTVPCQIKWSDDDKWSDDEKKWTPIEPGKIKAFWNSESFQSNYPQVRFKHNGKESVSDKLKTYSKIFGADVKDRIILEDTRQYHFGYDFRTNKLDIYDSEE